MSAVDTMIAPAIAGVDGWNYQQSMEADMTGDGVPERVVLTARVELYRGQPAWDDGQQWQVYVERTDSTRTYLYASFLQLGSLSMRLAGPPNGQTPSVLLLEQLPQRLRILESRLDSAGAVRTHLRFERDLQPGNSVSIPVNSAR